MENSMEQANQKNQEWKDRHDVDKAFEEFSNQLAYEENMDASYVTMMFEEEIKEFALYFAERVKGAEIKQK